MSSSGRPASAFEPGNGHPSAHLTNRLRVLVALASFGSKNESYLKRALAEYRAMPYQVDLVVLSNVPKSLGEGVEVRVGLPEEDPWSLPYGHKQLFAERIDDYDLFIYAEDDILITQRNIEAFLAASQTLPQDLIAGFVHAETDDQGGLHFDPVESHFHWDPGSVQFIEGDAFAHHTNEHSACFLLTREHLRRAIRSGGFLVTPHEGRYDKLCSASTDPYTQCGFKKLVCVSRLNDFTVHHLPNNKWAFRPYRASSVFLKQIDALLALQNNGRPRELLFNPETKVLNAKWSKNYYELAREDVISLVPSAGKNVLSIGCGWGATEGRLVDRGQRVVGIPMDSVIGQCAEDQGVEVVYGDFASARRHLEKERFDCILLIDTLHLVPDPTGVLSNFCELLAPGGVVVVATPNFNSLATYWRRFAGDPQHKNLGDLRKTGIHLTGPRVIRKWLRQCGLAPTAARQMFSESAQRLKRASFGLLDEALASDVVIAGRKPPVGSAEVQSK